MFEFGRELRRLFGAGRPVGPGQDGFTGGSFDFRIGQRQCDFILGALKQTRVTAKLFQKLDHIGHAVFPPSG